MNIQDYKRTLAQIISLAEAQKFGSACKMIEELLDRGVISAELLVHRGRFIQLLNEDDVTLHPHLTLETVLDDFKMAQELAPDSITPLIEEGYFEYAVQDNSNLALNTFIRAEALARSYLLSSIIGQVKCYQDLELFHKAQEKIDELKELFPNDPELEIYQ